MCEWVGDEVKESIEKRDWGEMEWEIGRERKKERKREKEESETDASSTKREERALRKDKQFLQNIFSILNQTFFY